MKSLGFTLLLFLIGGCAYNRPDHFYVLDSASPQTLDPRVSFAAEVSLRVTLPSLIDRSELVLVDAGSVQILEHERWAAPLGDQFAALLGQDLETRREDIILSSRRIAQPGIPSASIDVEVVTLDLRKNSEVRLEARWRMEDGRTGMVSQGRETFTAQVSGPGFPALTLSVSACVGLLADRLSAALPRYGNAVP